MSEDTKEPTQLELLRQKIAELKERREAVILEHQVAKMEKQLAEGTIGQPDKIETFQEYIQKNLELAAQIRDGVVGRDEHKGMGSCYQRIAGMVGLEIQHRRLIRGQQPQEPLRLTGGFVGEAPAVSSPRLTEEEQKILNALQKKARG